MQRRKVVRWWSEHRGEVGLLLLLFLAAALLRLLVYAWHQLYPLSGDEVAFFEQARTFVQGRGYQEQELMRGPLYPLFLAVVFRLFGAEVSAARLLQAGLGAAMMPLLYLWAGRRKGRTAGFLAAALGAAFFPLAVQATFLLTETLFLFLFLLGMVVWEGKGPAWRAFFAGLLFGLAALTRAVGLPLVLLAAGEALFSPGKKPARIRSALLVLAGAALVIGPWTARNVVVHQAPILVDTTGPTNLWLDNDPELGRDRVKAELLKYPEGERQALALHRGMESLLAHPAWFLEKAWREIQKFFSLEYFDDFLARPAIWYPPGEVWARVLLGDGLYLLLLAAGLVGLFLGHPRAVDLLWLAYLLATAALYHVELRYRLPFLVTLLPYAAAVLAHPRQAWALWHARRWRMAAAGLALLALGGLLLSHSNYPLLSARIAIKRAALILGEVALGRGDPAGAKGAARFALEVYLESAEARVLLARALRVEGQVEEAEAALRQAIAYRSGHPHPHLLLGDLLRAQGRAEEAARELAWEPTSLEDLQRWSWEHFASPPSSSLDLGSGLELGFVLGWHLPEREGEVTYRWSDAEVLFRLAVPSGDAPPCLYLRMDAGRPEALPLPEVELWQGKRLLARFPVENGWHTYSVPLGPDGAGRTVDLVLRAPTFRPHRYDPHLDDNRPLGVKVDRVWLTR
ncbi:MAG: glycosyltransferase family 39 protein [Chloroflexia bacterium]